MSSLELVEQAVRERETNKESQKLRVHNTNNNKLISGNKSLILPSQEIWTGQTELTLFWKKCFVSQIYSIMSVLRIEGSTKVRRLKVGFNLCVNDNKVIGQDHHSHVNQFSMDVIASYRR